MCPVILPPGDNPIAVNKYIIYHIKYKLSRSQWPRGLRRRSRAARLLKLWVRIPPGGMSVCCVLSGRCLCDELITRPEEYYRVWCVVVLWSITLVNNEVSGHWGGGWGCCAPQKNMKWRRATTCMLACEIQVVTLYWWRFTLSNTLPLSTDLIVSDNSKDPSAFLLGD